MSASEHIRLWEIPLYDFTYFTGQTHSFSSFSNIYLIVYIILKLYYIFFKNNDRASKRHFFYKFDWKYWNFIFYYTFFLLHWGVFILWGETGIATKWLIFTIFLFTTIFLNNFLIFFFYFKTRKHGHIFHLKWIIIPYFASIFAVTFRIIFWIKIAFYGY